MYGVVAAGAIRLAFRVKIKDKTKICLGPFDDRRPKGFRRSRKATPVRSENPPVDDVMPQPQAPGDTIFGI